VILAGRNVNEGMVERISERILGLVDSRGKSPSDIDVLVLGQTFKGDVADFRNSKAVRLADSLTESFKSVITYDPFGEESDSNRDPFEETARYSVVVLAVGHSEFIGSVDAVARLVVSGGVMVDLTGSVDSSRMVDFDLLFWKL